MSGKSISFNPNPRSKPQVDTSALDAFVKGDTVQPSPKGERSVGRKATKRLTFDIDVDLHKRIRMTCLGRDKEMAKELRRILEENFPCRAASP